MLSTKKILYRIILILNLLFILAALCVSVFSILNDESSLWTRLSSVCAVAALFSAAFYILKGFTKNAAMYFKLYALLFALSEFSSLLAIGVTVNEGAPVLCSGILFAIVLFMAIGLDVGKTRSFILCGIALALAGAQLALTATHVPGLLLGGTAYGSLLSARNVIKILLACLFGIMVYAKYDDKVARGTK